MGALSVGDAIGEGFRLIRVRPGSVLVWGALRTGYAVLLWVLMAPIYVARIEDLIARAHGGATSRPDLSSAMAMQGANLLTSFLGLAVSAVIFCAVFRAVLKPEEGRMAYLRLGSAEGFLFLFTFGIALAFIIAGVICVIPIAILVAVLAMAHAKAAAFLLMAALVVALLAAAVFVGCRLSVAGPMMVNDGRFHLMDAWTLTRGKAGDLFLIGFGVVLVVILIEVVLGAFGLAIALAVAGANLQSLSALFARPPGEIIAALSPTLVVIALISIPVFGCLIAIIGAPWARAWRDLAGPA